MVKKFNHEFWVGCAVEMSIDFDACKAASGVAAEAISIQWTGRPTRAVFPKYIEWVTGVMQEVCEYVGVSTAYIVAGCATITLKPGEKAKVEWWPEFLGLAQGEQN